MKAAILNGIDEPLTIQDIDKPVIGANEALIKLKAAAVNKRDWWIQKGQYANLKLIRSIVPSLH